MSDSITALTGRRHHVAIVLGSGLAPLASSLVGEDSIPYELIQGMPETGIEGHPGRVFFGEVAGVPTLAFAGRVHLYEGHAPGAITHAVTSAVEEGCEVVVLTNAAGAINERLEVGRPCLISDHLNLTGENPLVGLGDGRRLFIDLTEAYDESLRELARAACPGVQEGVYAGVTGPSYETPAEIRMLATMGADLVGMSTVLEAIAARFLGARVLGVSMVTNLAAGLARHRLSHEEVTERAKAGATQLEILLRGVIEGLR